jgi:hypothetical protein
MKNDKICELQKYVIHFIILVNDYHLITIESSIHPSLNFPPTPYITFGLHIIGISISGYRLNVDRMLFSRFDEARTKKAMMKGRERAQGSNDERAKRDREIEICAEQLIAREVKEAMNEFIIRSWICLYICFIYA